MHTGAHPASYPMGTGGSSLGVKWPGREADHSPHLVPRSRMRGAVPPSNTSSWHGAYISIGTTLPLPYVHAYMHKKCHFALSISSSLICSP
jgi:hypothetical protein